MADEEDMMEKVRKNAKCQICAVKAVFCMRMYESHYFIKDGGDSVTKSCGFMNVDLCDRLDCMKKGLARSNTFGPKQDDAKDSEEDYEVEMTAFLLYHYWTREERTGYQQEYAAEKWPPYEQFRDELLAE